jgi:hypothetical protein
VQELFKKGNNLLNVFWEQWSSDYLLSLRNRMRYDHRSGKSSVVTPKVGHVVVVKDKNLARGTWRLGQVEELIVGHDDVIRSALVRLSTGRVVGRPLRGLCPLECSDEPELPVVAPNAQPDEILPEAANPDDRLDDIVPTAPPALARRPKRESAIRAQQNWSLMLDAFGMANAEF